MASTIANGKNRPLNVGTGTVPDVSGGLKDWFQPMVFELVTKMTEAFQVVETSDPINFMGVIQPLRNRDLMLKPEGQRAWTWLLLHADPVLSLQVDEVVLYIGAQTRVMARKDFTIYGYVEYQLVQDWTGAGPSPVNETDVWDGGAPDTEFENTLTGGEPDTEFLETFDGGGVTQ